MRMEKKLLSLESKISAENKPSVTFWRSSYLELDEYDIMSDNVRSTISANRQASFQARQLHSPYDSGQANRRYKKIYPNRVYTPWYRRYVNKLPGNENLDFQPFDEVQRVDEDIAMQYFYGEDGHTMDTSADRYAIERRKSALQKYRKVKEQEERAIALAESDKKFGARTRFRRVPIRYLSEISLWEIFSGRVRRPSIKSVETEFGATGAEKRIYEPIVQFLGKLHLHKQRSHRKTAIRSKSKWHILRNPFVLSKLTAMYRKLLQEQIHARFRKVIKLVVAVIRFIETIRLISGDTKQILKEIDNFMTTQAHESNKSMLLGRKKIFHPQKYYISNELHIPFDTIMTLTKPWFTRRDSEIDSVIAVLQSYKSFVQYPPIFQRRLATLAWYIEAQADKYIIRERHIACDFYVLLTGKAKIVKVSGDPYIHGDGEIKFIRYIKKSEGFGDESMSDPECEREYSVISCNPCALLSVNVHDYLQMLSTRKEDEVAPEHILFLRCDNHIPPTTDILGNLVLTDTCHAYWSKDTSGIQCRDAFVFQINKLTSATILGQKSRRHFRKIMTTVYKQ